MGAESSEFRGVDCSFVLSPDHPRIPPSGSLGSVVRALECFILHDSPMVDHDAAILDDGDSDFAQSLGGRAVVDTELGPDGARALRQSQDFIDMGGKVL